MRIRLRTAIALTPVPITVATLLALACAPSARIHPRAAEEIRRGYVYLGDGDVERADVAFAHALEFDPDIPEALNGAAVVARRREDWRRTRRLLERALSVDGDFAEALVNLGELDAAEGLPEVAESRFRRALSIDPDLVPARLDLARTLLHRGRAALGAERDALWADARRHYLHLLESSPDLADAHHDLGYMDHEAGHFARAAASYERAAEIDPTYGDALLGACVAFGRAGRLAEAAAACRKCISASSRAAGARGSPPRTLTRGPGPLVHARAAPPLGSGARPASGSAADERCAASLRALEAARTR